MIDGAAPPNETSWSLSATQRRALLHLVLVSKPGDAARVDRRADRLPRHLALPARELVRVGYGVAGGQACRARKQKRRESDVDVPLRPRREHRGASGPRAHGHARACSTVAPPSVLPAQPRGIEMAMPGGTTRRLGGTCVIQLEPPSANLC